MADFRRISWGGFRRDFSQNLGGGFLCDKIADLFWSQNNQYPQGIYGWENKSTSSSHNDFHQQKETPRLVRHLHFVRKSTTLAFGPTDVWMTDHASQVAWWGMHHNSCHCVHATCVFPTHNSFFKNKSTYGFCWVPLPDIYIYIYINRCVYIYIYIHSHDYHHYYQ